MNRTNSNAGFTLIEILVVITIIALMTAVGLAAFSRANSTARDGKRKSDMEQLRAALVLYRTDNNQYPASVTFSSMAPLYPTYTTAGSMSDPKGASWTAYSYTSSPPYSTFTACAKLENAYNGSTNYCVTNP